jgi:hypothetical protein
VRITILIAAICILVTTRSYAFVFNDNYLTLSTCGELFDDIDNSVTCVFTLSTTTLPTAIIDEKNTSVGSLETLSKAIDETKMPADQALASQTIAKYFSVPTQEVQAVIEKIYNSRARVSLQNIGQELGIK